MQIIVFTGGEAPGPSKAASYFKNILADGENPIAVIAADSGLETLIAYKEYYQGLYDFSPTFVLGDFDSISDKKLLDECDQAIIERSPSYKDDTDTELALKRARELARNKERKQAKKTRGIPRLFGGKSLACGKKAFITLIGGAGGRPDHFLSIYNLFGTKIAPDAWLCGPQILYKAERSSFEISGLKTGDVISVARAFGKNRGGKIRSHGLEWESPLFRKNGMPSVSNTIKEEWARLEKPVQIDFLRGSFVLIAPLFASVRLNKGCTKK